MVRVVCINPNIGQRYRIILRHREEHILGCFNVCVAAQHKSYNLAAHAEFPREYFRRSFQIVRFKSFASLPMRAPKDFK